MQFANLQTSSIVCVCARTEEKRISRFKRIMHIHYKRYHCPISFVWREVKILISKIRAAAAWKFRILRTVELCICWILGFESCEYFESVTLKRTLLQVYLQWNIFFLLSSNIRETKFNSKLVKYTGTFEFEELFFFDKVYGLNLIKRTCTLYTLNLYVHWITTKCVHCTTMKYVHYICTLNKILNIVNVKWNEIENFFGVSFWKIFNFIGICGIYRTYSIILLKNSIFILLNLLFY